MKENINCGAIKVMLVIVLMMLSTINAWSFDVDVRAKQVIYSDSQTEPAQGLEVRAGGTLFIWGSTENPLLRLGSQPGANVILLGVGIGLKQSVGDFNFYIKGGYYFPKTGLVATYSEGVYILMTQQIPTYPIPSVGDPEFPHWQYDIHDAIGGEIGVEYRKQVYKAISIYMDASYRYLQLREYYSVSKPDFTTYLEMQDNRNFSAFTIGGGISIEWGI
ncbi:MAG: hypothetical protein WC637_00395 [Victivallales bacterium]|jgi:hypothetical protein